MYLIEDVRFASPTQLVALSQRKKLISDIEKMARRLTEKAAESQRQIIEIVEEAPVVERMPVRKYQPGCASHIVEATCRVCGEKYHVEPRDIMGRVRSAQIVKARHSAVYVLRNITLWSLPEIGRRLGGRDHTTVIHALRKFERLKLDVDAMAAIDELKVKTLAELKEGGVDLTVSPFGEQHVPEQQAGGEGTDIVAASTSLEDRGGVGDQVTETAEV